MRPDAWAGALSWWSCQSPGAHSWGLLNHPHSFHRGKFKLNAKLDADLLLYLLGHFECDGHTVHMLTQRHLPPPLTSKWSRHCSHMCLPVHSPWLPGFIAVVCKPFSLCEQWLDLVQTDLVCAFVCPYMGMDGWMDREIKEGNQEMDCQHRRRLHKWPGLWSLSPHVEIHHHYYSFNFFC